MNPSPAQNPRLFPSLQQRQQGRRPRRCDSRSLNGCIVNEEPGVTGAIKRRAPSCASMDLSDGHAQGRLEEAGLWARCAAEAAAILWKRELICPDVRWCWRQLRSPGPLGLWSWVSAGKRNNLQGNSQVEKLAGCNLSQVVNEDDVNSGPRDVV